jgi:hypothetical protein
VLVGPFTLSAAWANSGRGRWILALARVHRVG